MRVATIHKQPFAELAYLNALRHGQREEVALPLLRAAVIPGRYVLQTSSNLAAWAPLATNVTSSGQFAWPAAITNAGAPFYRTQQFVP
jgi:hypothetical protein